MTVVARKPGTPIAKLAHRAGHRCLDFVNSLVATNEPAPRDSLLSPSDYRIWAGMAGIAVDPQASEPVELAALNRARELRESILQILTAMLDGKPTPVGAIEHLTEEAARSFRSRRLAPADGHLAWQRTYHDLDSVTDLLAAEAAELFSRAGPLPLKRCIDADCGWFFLDTSRNKSRHWCSMTDCGNRAKARRHRARQQLEECAN
ncbi:CGNR zinc finger domain-containing protein [Hypericibacter sp.]|uniref:CGNR zinc finger domain-containing protein n=1 Tax=Hypericibacter sp. TaxID=2705401 RepID=UPI003D6D16B1